MDRIECAKPRLPRRPRHCCKFRIELDERQEREHPGRVGIRIRAGHGLHHLDHRDPARNEVVAPHGVLERCRLRLVDDELRDGRRVQIQDAQRGSPRRSPRSASVADTPVVMAIGDGSDDVSGFAAGVILPSSIKRASVVPLAIRGPR